jgi:phage shock protein C
MDKSKLIRHSDNTRIAGVCGAFADYFGWEAKTVRIVYTVLTVITAFFPGIILYLTLMLFIPREGSISEENTASDD